MDTVGSLVDKLATVNQKTFLAQELLHEIKREASFEAFKARYATDDGLRALWEKLLKLSDLNAQRNNLINEIDVRIVEMIKAGVAGQNLDDGSFIQRAHKTFSDAALGIYECPRCKWRMRPDCDPNEHPPVCVHGGEHVRMMLVGSIL